MAGSLDRPLASAYADGVPKRAKGKRRLIVLSREEDALVVAAAKAAAMPVATFIRVAAVREAKAHKPRGKP